MTDLKGLLGLSSSSGYGARAVSPASKVPEVTLAFWIIKILATTVGETSVDLLSIDLCLGLTGTSIVMGGFLLGMLGLQVASWSYVPCDRALLRGADRADPGQGEVPTKAAAVDHRSV